MKIFKELAIGFALGALFILVFFFVSLTAALPANAQEPVCADRQVLVDVLEGNWGETRQGYGLVNGADAVIEMFANAETGTWSLVLTMPDGQSCLSVAGQAWSVDEETPAGQPS